MGKIKLEELDEFFGNIQASVILARKEDFEKDRAGLENETKTLPACFQHRIALMRQYVEDFDIRFWKSILKCCKLAIKFYDACPDGDFMNLAPQKIDLIAQGFHLNQDEKTFALSLAIAKWHDENDERNFDNCLVLNIPDPWPINPLSTHLLVREIAVYRNSKECALIEHCHHKN